jgi:hypothetical protein
MHPQRELLKEKGYVLVRECEFVEDFWINPKYISKEQYERFVYINLKDRKEIHFWEYCKNINHDFTKFYI